MEYLLGLIGLLLAAFGYNWVKRRGAEALLENNEVKSKLNEQDKNKAQNDGLLGAEEKKREDLQQNADERKNKPVDPTDF